jgi:hypothetical protein
MTTGNEAMPDNSSVITINKCPACQGTHEYRLKVEYSSVLKMILMSDLMSDMKEKPRIVRLTRLFTCPVKDATFQAELIFHDYSSSRIKSVEVVGLVEGSSDE